jgi:diaminobutyrate-2-oxoglutarate transaminase
VSAFLQKIADQYPETRASVRGRGLAWGLAFDGARVAQRICREAFANGLLVETSGPDSDVVKLMPPLTVSVVEELEPGLAILGDAVDRVLSAELAGNRTA